MYGFLFRRLKQDLSIFPYFCSPNRKRRDARAVERGGLENRCPLTGTKGSNPFLSASQSRCPAQRGIFIFSNPQKPGLPEILGFAENKNIRPFWVDALID